jgi:hypothetical protein
MLHPRRQQPNRRLRRSKHGALHGRLLLNIAHIPGIGSFDIGQTNSTRFS